MTQKNYEIIKDYFGIKFIQYIINYSDDINGETKFEELKLNENQRKVLIELISIQRLCREAHISQGHSGDGFEFWITEIEPYILNNFRRSCRGNFPQIEKSDSVFEFLSNLMIQSYPYLLIKSKYRNRLSRYLFPSSNSFFRLLGKFEPLLKKDVLNKLTNKKDGFDYVFQFELSNGFEIDEQAHFFPEIIIRRAFQNSCNQMNYTLENCLNELKLLLKSLRELAEGKTVEFSYFFGLPGIRLKQPIKIDGLSIYPLDSIDNPGLYVRYISSHSENKLFGAIACIKISVKAVGQNKENICGDKFYFEEYKQEKKLMDRINLSLFFSTKKNTGITQGFTDSGFVFRISGGSFNSRPFYGLHILDNSNFNLFSSWLRKINNSIYDNLQIPLERLILTLTARRNLIDMVIDNVIAWESLFGSQGETTLKVCESILKLLDCEDKKDFYDKLKEVYNARSQIVHGGESNFNKLFKKVKDPKKFVCDVTRRCLVKLIDERSDLIPLTPEERYKSLLLGIEKKEP